MARKSKINNLYLILIIIFISAGFYMLMMGISEKKEPFKNTKENFEQMRQSNGCNTCKVKNQG